MTENASHVVFHHLFDGVSMLNMTCCITLSVVVVLILLIILVLVIYIVILKTKQRLECSRTPNLMGSRRNTSRAVSNSYKEEISNRSNQFPVFENHGMDINSDLQDIPMSTFKTDVDGRRAASSNSSSGGLREFLFPSPHEGEIIYEPPPKVVAFAGQVFETPRVRSRGNSVAETKASKFGNSARGSDSINTSMEWDYYETKRYCPSNISSETRFDGKRTVNICWV